MNQDSFPANAAKTECVRIIKFDAGHRVVNHESKCRTLHGHEYKAEIYAKADRLDALGRVIDFSVIKEKIGSWIDLNWDHNLIIWRNDPNLPHIERCEGHKKPFIADFNPTVENMAAYLLQAANDSLLAGAGVRITKIRLWETSNCYVEVSS
jgi:6-pyruvoyltetrahydropterin/6-carboxytetrahydropterin synthase